MEISNKQFKNYKNMSTNLINFYTDCFVIVPLEHWYWKSRGFAREALVFSSVYKRHVPFL